ncbi:uncharacterized protein C11orf16 homolog [Brienomyrus brachyistius]|uniref:uncharacterized protein C11orf16 homolog n=1 Tax=Brienomyrus brachyistius TaxID=42636 RepID=UPI0020B221AE|nr:uncharacterized protein C11orf16 homolog [Brienomyrus brachyistius]
MPVSAQSLSCHSALPLLMGLRQNVTFAIDTSEGMYSVLRAAKDLLVQTLAAKATLRDSLFNLIGYSHKVTKWRSHMVTCCPDLACEAQGWIHALCCTPGRNLLAALSEALADPACQVVHLLTNGLPDNPQELLREVPRMVKTRRVHIFYLSDKGFPDRRTREYLQCLSLSTGGGCHVLSLCSSGAVEVRHLYLKECCPTMSRATDVKYCSAAGAHNTPPSWEPHVCLSHLPRRWTSPVSTCHMYSCDLQRRCLSSPELATGSRVLAQRELDGFYYLGTIKDIVQGRRGVFLVEFDRPTCKGAPCESLSLQHASLTNIVPHVEAHQHCLRPGDKVLAPSDEQLSRYEPGSVLLGEELRNPLGARNMNSLQVLFWNGRQAMVPGDLAVWISPSLYERIVRELQWSPPGIPRRCFPGQCRHGDMCHPPWPSHNFSCSPGCPFPASPFSCPCRQWRPLPLSTCHVISLRDERDEMPWEDLERKVDFQLKELQEERKIPSSFYSHSSGGNSEASDGALKSSGVEMVSQATNTDLCLPQKPSSASPGRPQWKYWRRSQTEPQRKLSSVPVHSSLRKKTFNANRKSENGTESSTNHSSLFQPVPVSGRTRTTVKDAIGQSDIAECGFS